MPIMRLVLGLMRGFGALPRHFKTFIIMAAIVLVTFGAMMESPVGFASAILAARDGLSCLANPFARLIKSLTNADWSGFEGLIFAGLAILAIVLVGLFSGSPRARVSPEQSRRSRETRKNLSGTR